MLLYQQKILVHLYTFYENIFFYEYQLANEIKSYIAKQRSCNYNLKYK